MQMTPETNLFYYDFALSDELNEKLKQAVMLLDQVRFKLAYDGKDYTQGFVNELNQATEKITNAIRGLDQEPIV